MKNAKISELKNNLSRLLAYVRRGGRVRVFDRDRPVADLVPCELPGSGDAGDARLRELELEGILRRGTGRLPEGFLEQRLPKTKVSVLEALLDERAEAR